MTAVLDLPSVEEANKAARSAYHCIGSGIDRTVYRMPGSRWVYKVDDHRGGPVNEAEYRAYLKYRDTLPEGIKFPEMHMLPNGILAAEFIEDESAEVLGEKNTRCEFGWCSCQYFDNDPEVCWVKPWIERMQGVPVTDIHGGNVRITRDGTIYIIDLGEHYG